MTLIEIIAVCFSLACTWLAVKKHILNWPMGIIGVSAYMILFYRERLYADMVLQVVFIIQGIYGWHNWSNKKENDLDEHYKYLSASMRYLFLFIIISASIIWGILLHKYTNASSPFIDALVSTISLIANWLMAKKKIENWLLWILADIIYIVLFWYKDLYLSSGIYFIFLILSIKGLVDWSKKRHIKKDLF